MSCHLERSRECRFGPPPHSVIPPALSVAEGIGVRNPSWVLIAALLLGAFTSAFAQKEPPPKPLDLNTATVEQLETLPGVGPVIAKAIVDFREKSGPFRRVEDLLAIRGITERRLNELRPLITVRPEKNSTPPSSGATLRPTVAQPFSAVRGNPC
jgi:competence ComEA-like helix-hairpin-helix protein